MKHVGTLVLTLSLALPAPAALAHGGEDHGDASAPPAFASTGATAARAAATSEEFELVAALEGDSLRLYLDRYASNEPVADALIEVDGVAATAIAPGVHALPAQHLSKPGRHALAVSVQTEDSADLLSVTLDVPAPPAAESRVGTNHVLTLRDFVNNWALWGASGALLLLVGGLAVPRLRARDATVEA